MEAQFENLRSKLIVSCQALEDEPLHSSFIMGRMAKAAYEGGAAGIRANTVEDILEIRKNVSLPIIGIIKEVYDNSEVYITPTLKEVDALMEIKPEIIAVDATKRIRPDGTYLKEFFDKLKYKYPDQKFMADCSTVEEALFADEIGFDFIGTTLVGYTPYSVNDKIEQNDFEIIRMVLLPDSYRISQITALSSGLSPSGGRDDGNDLSPTGNPGFYSQGFRRETRTCGSRSRASIG